MMFCCCLLRQYMLWCPGPEYVGPGTMNPCLDVGVSVEIREVGWSVGVQKPKWTDRRDRATPDGCASSCDMKKKGKPAGLSTAGVVPN